MGAEFRRGLERREGEGLGAGACFWSDGEFLRCGGGFWWVSERSWGKCENVEIEDGGGEGVRIGGLVVG